MYKSMGKLTEMFLKNYQYIDDYIIEYINSKEYRPNTYAITMYDDLMITKLREVQQAINYCLIDLEDYSREVINLHFRNHDWKDIADATGLSISECKKIKNTVVNILSKKIFLIY